MYTRAESPPESTTVCVVGAGPAGMVLAFLLARQGIRVTLLEAHENFDRQFRGDTLHSPTMDLVDDLGLTDKLERIVHTKLGTLQVVTPGETLDVVRLSGLPIRHPYVALVPQDAFLGMLAEEGRGFPEFDLRMGCPVDGLVEEDGVVVGVRFRQEGAARELRATLVVGADGRGSRIRSAAGLELRKTAAPMDVLWFDLPRQDGDERIEPFALRMGRGRILVTFDRRDHWQAGLIILKGTARELHAQGIESVRDAVATLAPPFADRLADALRDWSCVQMLAVQVGRVDRWSRPGLLLLGDAAHVMSPAGGVGINYAVQDAIAAANLLTGALQSGSLSAGDLAAVQARRDLPTRIIQSLQALAFQAAARGPLTGDGAFRMPWIVRLVARIPLLGLLPAWVVSRGFRPERLAASLRRPRGLDAP